MVLFISDELAAAANNTVVGLPHFLNKKIKILKINFLLENN